MRTASFAMSIAKADVNSATPQSTGTRPRATALPASITAIFSALESEQFSPDGAADDEPRHAVADQPFHDARGGVDVEREIGAELGGDGGEDAFPANVLAHGGLLRMGTGQRS